MASDKKPTTIKKYANRRLYNTGTSTYVTLEDLATMVKAGEDFQVYDAKSGEDITRAVLGQIIFEQENKAGQGLLPTAFLRQLIRFYGDSMQMLVPSYLEFSIDQLTHDQHSMRDQMSKTMGGSSVQSHMFEALEEQTRKNMQMFSQALTMFNPFAMTQGVGMQPPAAPASARNGEASASAPTDSEFETLKKQMADMQRQIQGLVRRD